MKMGLSNFKSFGLRDCFHVKHQIKMKVKHIWIQALKRELSKLSKYCTNPDSCKYQTVVELVGDNCRTLCACSWSFESLLVISPNAEDFTRCTGSHSFPLMTIATQTSWIMDPYSCQSGFLTQGIFIMGRQRMWFDLKRANSTQQQAPSGPLAYG